MIAYGPLIGRKQVRKVEKTATKVSTKSSGMVSRMLRRRCTPALFEKGTFDHHRYIKKVLPVALLYGKSKFGNNWTFQQDNGTPHIHQETQEWCSQHFPSFIDKDTWPANSPNLNPSNYCIWNEFAQTINWDNVTSKISLIAKLKRGVKKIRFGCCKKKLFRLDESFVSHDTKRRKLFKRIKAACLIEN